MIDSYTDFQIVDDGSVVATTNNGDSVQFPGKWTAPEAVSTIVRLAVPMGAVETTDGATLAADRGAAIEGLAETVDDEEEPLLPDERHAAAVLDFLVAHGHAAREGDTYYFHPPGGESTGLGYAGALYAVADATESTAETIESIEAATEEQPESLPPKLDETAASLETLSAQRSELTATAEQLRSNAKTVERSVLEQATLNQIDLDAVDRLGEAVERLAERLGENSRSEADDTVSDGE